MKVKVLIVDDDQGIRTLLTEILRDDYEVAEASSGAALRRAFGEPPPDVIILDVNLKDDNGLKLLPDIKKRWPKTEVIVLTGTAKDSEAVSWAVDAIKLGAFNFLRKIPGDFDAEKLAADVKCAVELKQQKEENTTLHHALETMSVALSPVFRSAAMQHVVRTVERVAPSDVTILLTGESGTGKEVIADLIHALSPRNKNKIIKINCAALPRELIESELFGSVKGAYTGAHADRVGLFRQAENGTLLLDEISEMPADTQSKLLRVLQDREVRPVGDKTSYKTNCRILASTNRNPEEAIREGKLRDDLFYRISTISVHLPPLRDRQDDIMPLASAFLKRFAAQANRDVHGFKTDAIDKLNTFDWPGNVRQLQNEVQRAVLLCEDAEVSAADLSITHAYADSMPGGELNPDRTLLKGVERNTIIQTLKQTAGNKAEAAKRLGIGRPTLYHKLKVYGIDM